MSYFGSWFELMTVVVAGVALGVSYMAYRYSKIAAITNLFIALRSRYLEIHGQLPLAVRLKGWVPVEDTDEWRAIERYWYVSFDEWFSTRKLGDAAGQRLWDEFYCHALQSSLKNFSMRKVLLNMLHGSVSFGSFLEEFRSELTTLWKNSYPELTSLEENPVDRQR